MSNPDPLFQNLSFDPEQVTAVNQAYEVACRTLQNIGLPLVTAALLD